MKRMIICLIMIMALMANTIAFSQDINDTVLSVKETIKCSIPNLTEINTVTPENAGFELEFYVRNDAKVTYIVNYKLNGGSLVEAGTVDVEPEKKTKRFFRVNAPNGSHTLNVDVLKNGVSVKSFDFNFVVMQEYQKQFMDMYNPLGFCTHFGHFAENSTTNESSLEDLKFIKASGAKRIRDGFMPNRTEPAVGQYNFFGGYRWTKKGESWVGWWLEPVLQQDDISLYPVVSSPSIGAYHTDLPSDVKKTSREIRTTKSIKGYGDFFVESLKQVPGIKSVEIHNEPNISGFWTSQADSDVDYTNLLKQTALAIRDYSDDVRLDAFSVTDATFAWTDRCIIYGAYPYFDAISYHPYAYHNDVEYKDTLFNKLWNAYEAIDRYGGWKEFTVTEIGQPTFLGNKLGEEEGAERTVKQLFMLDSFNCRHTDIYSLINTDYEEVNDRNDREQNFGLLKWYKNGERYAKDGYVAAAQYSNQLAGAVFIGEVDLGDGFYAYLYNKDGKPKMAVWYYAEDSSTKELSFDGESVTVTDIYGNIIEKSVQKINLGASPVYVSDLSEKWFVRASHEEISEYNSRFIELYGSLNEDVSNSAKTVFENAENVTKDICDAESLNKLMDDYFALGYKILGECKNGKLSEKDASSMLFGLYKSINVLNNYYMVKYDGNADFSFNVSEAEKLVADSYKNNKNIKQYTDAIYRYVKRYATQAKEVASLKEQSPIKNGVVNAWNNLANGIYGWMKEFNSFETVTEYGLTIRVPGYDTECFVGDTKNIRTVLENDSAKNFEGTLNVYNEKGELVAKSSSFKLDVGQTLDKPIDVKIGQPENGVSEIYEFALVDNNENKISVQKMRMRMQNSITVTVLPVNENISEIKNISVSIKNNRKEKYSISFETSTSENMKIDNSTLNLVLEPLETRVISIPVLSVEDTKYRTYAFSYKAIDQYEQVTAFATQLLSFTSIVKSDEEIDVSSFDGTVSAWDDAYPIYINQPQEAGDYNNWAGGNNATRAFFKWDEDSLYMLAEVYDDVQNQQYTGTSIWQGDSIQLALDCLNTKSKSYDDDDYEIGFAYGSSGNDFWSWRGEVSGDMLENIKVVRDEEDKVTRYLVKFPKACISNLSLADNNKLGLNMAVNDADVYTRDAYYQFSLGLAGTEGKHPSMYETFTLCTENKNNVEGFRVFK